MRIRFILLVCLFVGVSNSVFCQSKNDDGEKKYLVAEKQLKRTYADVLIEYENDSAFIKHLKKSQELWVQFRNAEMEMNYPDTLNGHYSTSYYQCVFAYKTKLTKERITALNVWLSGSTKNEECVGSLKVKGK